MPTEKYKWLMVEESIMKKIAYVIPVFPVASETFITTEMKALMDCGHSVQGICFELRDKPCQVGDEAIEQAIVDLRGVSLLSLKSLIFKVLIRFFRTGWKAIKFCLEQQGIRPRSLLLQGLKLAYVVDKTNCQHIHAHFALCSTATAIVAARLLGLNVSFTSHGSDVYKSPADLALKLQNADFSIAVCKRMQKDFEHFQPMARVFNIPCGVDTSFFQRRVSGSEQRLIYLGRISETKGLLHLIQAMAKLPMHLRPRIDIAGDGPMRIESENMVRDFGLSSSIKFLGGVSRIWVQKYCSRYAAMVLPFCKVEGGIMDTGPLVLKEAMALKLPLLTTDIMAAGEFIDADCAFISKSSDPDDLARTLLTLLLALDFISLTETDIHNLIPTLGRQVLEINSLANRYQGESLLAEKVERAYQKVIEQFSSRQQGLALSQIFQQCD
jgi:glycosyltransferase involved in cell wall biosynthesis